MIPDPVPEGHIYYTTKGDFVRRGVTALVERLPSGAIVKTPTTNPHWPSEEERARQSMEHEHNIYVLLGSNPFIPKLFDWDDATKTMVIEHLPNGDLESYLAEYDNADASTRQRWALQASQAIQGLYAAGVVHQGVTPRNFLLDENLNLRICDFAGSSYLGHSTWTVTPGPRYQSWTWDSGYKPTLADDVFSLGSLLYFIATGKEPYSELEEDEVERRFGGLDFPTCDESDYGAIIQGCWSGQLSTVEAVIQALIHSFGASIEPG